MAGRLQQYAAFPVLSCAPSGPVAFLDVVYVASTAEMLRGISQLTAPSQSFPKDAIIVRWALKNIMGQNPLRFFRLRLLITKKLGIFLEDLFNRPLSPFYGALNTGNISKVFSLFAAVLHIFLFIYAYLFLSQCFTYWPHNILTIWIFSSFR